MDPASCRSSASGRPRPRLQGLVDCMECHADPRREASGGADVDARRKLPRPRAPATFVRKPWAGSEAAFGHSQARIPVPLDMHRERVLWNAFARHPHVTSRNALVSTNLQAPLQGLCWHTDTAHGDVGFRSVLACSASLPACWTRRAETRRLIEASPAPSAQCDEWGDWGPAQPWRPWLGECPRCCRPSSA